MTQNVVGGLASTHNRGITIITLIITIIVMLILVAVTINIAINGGLFEYARTANEKTIIAQEEEQISLAWRLLTIEKITGKINEIDENNFEEKINSLGNNTQVDYVDNDTNNDFSIVFIDSNREYIIDKDGNITLKGIKIIEDNNKEVIELVSDVITGFDLDNGYASATTYTSGREPNRAFDGGATNGWQSSLPGSGITLSDQYLYYTFNSPVNVKATSITNNNDEIRYNYGIKDFEFQYYNGSEWVTLGTGTVNKGSINEAYVEFETVIATQFRWHCLNNHGGYSDTIGINKAQIYDNDGNALIAHTRSLFDIGLGQTFATTFTNGREPNRAFDGGATNGWQSSLPGSGIILSDQYLYYTFKLPVTAKATSITNNSNEVSYNYGVKDFEFQYYNGTEWITLGTGTVNKGSINEAYVEFEAVTATQFRWHCLNNHGGYSDTIGINKAQIYDNDGNALIASKKAFFNIGDGFAFATTFTNGREPNRAFDGGATNGWQSSLPGSGITLSDQYLYYIFNTPVTVIATSISNNSNEVSYNYGVKDFEFQYYNGTEWITLGTGTVSKGTINEVYVEFEKVTATQFRWHCLNNHGGYSDTIGINKAQIYGWY